ncbi:isopentenyl-diphosphate Delta-isomerase [Asanoa iriomotensis]|uniref:Isopentenyl-diphosphate Delta-isomerase n=1 Tax=Asanoa iriomotensis TaxID=234613 RepID=A0ABQ4C4K1_9ACTN|nr:isopentenyl-diphosphate Delta-isomerase [Asanoa iriomotensis]GIF57713.1 isopentenyl-diphosphate Delta-isomerase [Asanoa iriomotensis]
MTDSRERHLVELVDDDGLPIGSETVEVAHQRPGQLHRAFSVVLMDPAGRVLLQRRAAVKTRFPLRWANTCCGHPAPGEEVTVSANRRLKEELGAAPVSLSEVGVYVYYAEDPSTGRVEWEYDHVLLGQVTGDEDLVPDPDEVAELAWVDPQELPRSIRAEPTLYSPWLAGVINQVATAQGGRSVGAAAGPAEADGDTAERSGGR